MLNKNHITDIPALSEAWHYARLSKFTASEWHFLMGEKPFTQGALSYLYRKVGEEASGLPARDNVDTVATEWGKKTEPEAIVEFGKSKGLEFMIVQKLICRPDSRFGCTPDALIIHNESIDKQFYNVSTVEVKCPFSFDSSVALFLCKSPADVKKQNKEYFHQVLFQMELCDSLIGYLVIYQPMFRVNKMNVIEFRKLHLREDFKLLKERMDGALVKYNEIRNQIIGL